MSDYSNLTLNLNYAARRDSKQPTLKGDLVVVAGIANHETEFDVAAFGPKQSKDGGREYYDLEFTPKDPIAATRRFANAEADNKPEKFELNRVNSGRVFIRSDEEVFEAKEKGKDLPKLSGYGLVALAGMTKPVYLELPVWKREGSNGRPGFLSGTPSLHDPEAVAARRQQTPEAVEPSRPRQSRKAQSTQTLDV